MAPPPKSQTKLAKCCRYCRIVTTFFFSHVGLCALVLAYAFGGAFTFHFLESTNEERVRNETRAKRLQLVQSLWQLTENQSVLKYDEWIAGARTELMAFEEHIIRAVKNDGFDGNEFGDESQWSVTGAMLYSIIVITTIGYGNIAPKTPIGRLVTMFYAIAGIPLMLYCLSNIGNVMAHSFKFIYWKLCYALCIKQKTKKKIRHHHHHHHHHRVINQQPGPGVPGSRELEMQSISSNVQFPVPSRHEAKKIPIISNKYADPSDEGHYDTYPFRERSNNLFRERSNNLFRERSNNPFPERSTNPKAPLSRMQMLRPPPLTSTMSLPNHLNPIEESASSSESEEEEEEGNVPIIMCMGLVVGYICGGAWLFRKWEQNWSYLDSAYFCFVTLTTIGFGDMVPGAAVVSGTDEGRTTLIICALYLLFGMALLAMSFNLVQEEVAKSVRQIGMKVGIISDAGKTHLK